MSRELTTEQATRRMLRCLDAYWTWYENDEDMMQMWWHHFEKYRALVESRIGRHGEKVAP